jgi:hypothetical protein
VTLEELADQIHRDLTPEFEARLRAALAGKDREWLVDQLVAAALADRARRTRSQSEVPAEDDADRDARTERVKALAVDSDLLRDFAARFGEIERQALIAAGHLAADPPVKGTDLLTSEHRSRTGDALLQHAEDVLFAALFGDESTATSLDRVQRELLTLAVPRAKAPALDFMRASTELAAAGTWQDPDNVSNDEQADNLLIEVEFGETADEVVGRAIVAALALINNLEINEQVLYARMVNVEDSTLID